MKTVLAAIDFSPISRRVEREAIDLGRALPARVILFHSVVPPPVIATDVIPLGPPVLEWTDTVEKAAARHLRRVQRRWAGQGVDLDTMCTSGFAAQGVLDAARKVSADYIVLGSHGHTAFHDLVAGSTASGVLKRAGCPVVVVPSMKKDRKPQRRRGRA